MSGMSFSSNDKTDASIESIDDEHVLLTRESREDALKKEILEERIRKRVARDAMQKRISLDIIQVKSRGSSESQKDISPVPFRNQTPIQTAKFNGAERSVDTDHMKYSENESEISHSRSEDKNDYKIKRDNMRKTKSMAAVTANAGDNKYGARILRSGNSSLKCFLPRRSKIFISPQCDAEMQQSDAMSERTPILSPAIPEYDSLNKPLPHAEGGKVKPPKDSDLLILADKIFSNYVNILLLFAPVAFVAYHNSWSAQAQFWIAFAAMIPLACILGDLTEELALHTNQVMGGLINATFGNAVEVVVAVNALRKNEFRIVQASMVGSIYSNLLLVLGCSFFFGGLVHYEQSFNHMIVTANMGMLCLSSIAFVLPTQFAEYYTEESEDVLVMSRIVACFLILIYMQLLFFQLKTHSKYFDDDDKEEEPEFSLISAIVYLIIVTIFIAKLSDILVESIDGFCASSGLSKSFVGLVILPIVGNAVEHLTAIRCAMHDKMDLTMGVAIGSSVQISLFVAPLTVLVGWHMDKPMTLTFPQYEITLYALSVIVVAILVSNAKSNWLEGSVLVSTYVLIAIGFWYEKYEDVVGISN